MKKQDQFKNKLNKIIGTCSLIFLSVIVGAQIPATIDFSAERGLYDNPFSLTLSTVFTGKTIRYTTNGSEPTPSNGTVYSSPIPINTTATIKAIAYSNAADTLVATHSYIFIDDVVNQPATEAGFPTGEMDFDGSILNNPTYSNQLRDALLQIPTISLVLEEADFEVVHNSNVERKVSMEVIYPDGKPSFQEYAGVKRVGGSSFNSKKRNLRLSFRSEYGSSKLEYPLLGPDADDKFDQISLRPGFHGCINRNEGNDLADQVVRNFQIYTQDDGVGIHGVWMHLYINGKYWGVYNPSERGINYFGAKYYGGDKDNWDVIKRDGLALDGNETAWNTLQSFASLDLSNPANYNNIQEYLELEQFVDYILVCNYAPHADWHNNGKNGFYMRDRTGTDGFRFYVWDVEPSLGHNWTWTVRHTGGGPFDNLYQALLANPDFKTLVADRMQCHCFDDGTLTPAKAIAEYETQYNIVDKAMIAEAARWSTASSYVNFQDTKNRIVNNYFPARTNATITNYKNKNYYPSIDAVQFSQNGGSVPANYSLILSNPNGGGTIYYTTNGEDPRASGGGISSSAQVYSGAVSINGVTQVKARIKNGSTWSAMCPKFFYGPQNYSDLVINEIHYNPGSACQMGLDGDEYEFVEIKNKGTQAIDLTHVELKNGISYKFEEGTSIAGNGFIVLAHNATAFQTKYGFAPFGEYTGKLNNGGEGIELYDPLENLVEEVIYNDNAPWPLFPDGEGPSLELIAASLDNSLASSWQSSQNDCGTPNAENSTPCNTNPPALVINEINYHSPVSNDAGDWIEIYNPTNNAVNLAGWFFQDGSNSFTIPSGTNIPGNGYLVLVQNSLLFDAIHPLISNSKGSFGFGLNNSGEMIRLLSPTNCLVDRVEYNDVAPWPTAPDSLGPALSLIDPSLNNELAGSWEDSPENLGTPGRENTPCPEANFTVPAQICINVNATFLVSDPQAGATYQWTFPGGTPSTASGLSATTVWNTASNFNAELEVTYFECSTSKVNAITVENCNNAPNANNDNYNVQEDNTFTGNVLTNDSDPDGDQLTVNTLPVVAPTNGTLTLNANGSFTYNPMLNFYGNDSFNYRVCDDGIPQICRTATANITVNPVNDTPTAANDNASTQEDTPVTFSLVNNDNDIDGNLNLNSISLMNLPPSNQGVASVSNGMLTFSPASNFSGTVTTFQYEICDTGTPTPAKCATASILITVGSVNDAPVAMDEAFTLQEDGQISDNTLTNDSDIEGGNLTVNSSPVSGPSNGMVSLLGNGNFTYTPAANYAGTDLFVYEVCDDGTPVLCDQATVSFTVNPVNDAPTITDDNASTQEDTPVSINLIANDNDIDGNLNIASINLLTTPPSSQGMVSLSGANLTFTPATNFNGIVTAFQYEICDTGTPAPPKCGTAFINLVVSSTNDAPVAAPENFTLNEDASVSGNVVTNDTDPDGNNLTITTTPIVDAEFGVVVLNANGSFTYTPNGDYNGMDDFIYEVCDNGTPSLCAQATVTLTINPLNDEPVLADDNFNVLEDQPLVFSIIVNDNDIDGNLVASSIVLSNLPPSSQGVVTNNANGNLTFTPATNFHGNIATFQYQICDDGTPLPAKCATANVNLTVQPQNDPPSAQSDLFTTLEDQPLTGNLLANDTDLDGDNLIANTSLINNPMNGVATLSANGDFSYTSSTNYYGNDSFIYEVCDDDIPSLCDQTTVLIGVDPVNDPPVANPDYQNTLEEQPINIDILGNDVDVDGQIDPTQLTILNNPIASEGSLIVNPDKTITFVPTLNFFGSVSVINYEICDNGFPAPAACSNGTIHINVTSVNDAPIALPDTVSTVEDNAISGDVIQNDSDIDGNTLTVNTTPSIPPANGNVIMLVSGYFSYTPTTGFSGTDSFEYEVCDNGSPVICTNAIVTILIESCPEAIILPPNSICATSSGLFEAVDQGGQATYSWSFGAGASPQFSTNRTETVIYLTSGLKTVTLTVNRNGCQRTTTGSVTVGQAAFADAGADASLCFGDAEQLGGVPTAPSGATIAWSPVAGLNNPTASNPVAFPTITTTYTVTVTLGNCVITDEVLVEVQDQSSLFADAGLDKQNCGEGVQLGGNPSGPSDANYSWSPAISLDDPSSPNPISNAPVTTVYTLTVSKEGCSVTDQVEVIRKFAPSVDAGQDQTICLDPNSQGVILGGPNNLPISQYQWSPTTGLSHPTGGNTYANPNITTTYILSASKDGCISMDEVTVYVNVCNEYPVTMPDIDTIEINEILYGNVLNNDMDPDGDNLTLMTNPIANVQNGTLTLFPNGDIEYVPNADYVGYDNFVYQVCDDGIPSLCSNSVMGIWIEQPACVGVDINVWLEGPFVMSSTQMTTTLNNVRGLLPGQQPSNPLVQPTPVGQPYSIDPWNYFGPEGDYFSNNPYPVEAVDWMLLSFREELGSETTFFKTAALVYQDGSINLVDTCFRNFQEKDSMYILLEHRNHLPVLSKEKVHIINGELSYDFRNQDSYAIGGAGQKQLLPGMYGMIIGDCDQESDNVSFDINGKDKILWTRESGFYDVYNRADMNLDGDINGQDKVIFAENNGVFSAIPK